VKNNLLQNKTLFKHHSQNNYHRKKCLKILKKNEHPIKMKNAIPKIYIAIDTKVLIVCF